MTQKNTLIGTRQKHAHVNKSAVTGNEPMVKHSSKKNNDRTAGDRYCLRIAAHKNSILVRTEVSNIDIVGWPTVFCWTSSSAAKASYGGRVSKSPVTNGIGRRRNSIALLADFRTIR